MDAASPALARTFASVGEAFKNSPAPERKDAIAKVSYSHDAMIDMIVANPWINQGQLAAHFGYTEGWVSQVIASNAFQARLEQRKDALVDPLLRATIDENFKGLIRRSIEILHKKLEQPLVKISDELVLRALEVASKAAGYGAKGANVAVQNNFVVQVPAKEASAEDWAKRYGAAGQAGHNPPSVKTNADVVDAEVLVEPSSGAPNTKQLLAQLKGS